MATGIESLGVDEHYGQRPLHEQSHGEAFFALFAQRFGDGGLYILDEPEAALSPSRQLAMLARMHRLSRGGAQMIIATHSPIILAFPDAQIFVAGDDGLKPTRYQDTEHFTVARAFLGNPERFLRQLLADEDGSA